MENEDIITINVDSSYELTHFCNKHDLESYNVYDNKHSCFYIKFKYKGIPSSKALFQLKINMEDINITPAQYALAAEDAFNLYLKKQNEDFEEKLKTDKKFRKEIIASKFY